MLRRAVCGKACARMVCGIGSWQQGGHAVSVLYKIEFLELFLMFLCSTAATEMLHTRQRSQAGAARAQHGRQQELSWGPGLSIDSGPQLGDIKAGRGGRCSDAGAGAAHRASGIQLSLASRAAPPLCSTAGRKGAPLLHFLSEQCD